MPNQQIQIRNNGRIADQDCRKRLTTAGDTVEWKVTGNGTYSVHFTNGSPFSSSDFPGITASNPVGSGTPTGSANRLYKYEVRNEKGDQTDDPDILVEL